MSTSPSRVVLITGGGTGIGAATAALLASDGHRVVIAGRRSGPLEDVAARTGATAAVCDSTRPEDIERLVALTLAAHGRVDGLVLNAGVMRAGSVGELSSADWDACLATNLTGPFLLARAALPHLIACQGAVVAVSSVAGLRAPSKAAGYAASKAGLLLLCQSIACDYGARGVRANAVCPGWIRTEMADEEMSAFGDDLDTGRDAAYAEVTRLVPQRRPGRAEEAAQAIAWLLSPLSSYVNGAVLTVDGGAAAVDVGTVAYDFTVTPR